MSRTTPRMRKLARENRMRDSARAKLDKRIAWSVFVEATRRDLVQSSIPHHITRSGGVALGPSDPRGKAIWRGVLRPRNAKEETIAWHGLVLSGRFRGQSLFCRESLV